MGKSLFALCEFESDESTAVLPFLHLDGVPEDPSLFDYTEKYTVKWRNGKDKGKIFLTRVLIIHENKFRLRKIEKEFLEGKLTINDVVSLRGHQTTDESDLAGSSKDKPRKRNRRHDSDDEDGKHSDSSVTASSSQTKKSRGSKKDLKTTRLQTLQKLYKDIYASDESICPVMEDEEEESNSLDADTQPCSSQKEAISDIFEVKRTKEWVTANRAAEASGNNNKRPMQKTQADSGYGKGNLQPVNGPSNTGQLVCSNEDEGGNGADEVHTAGRSLLKQFDERIAVTRAEAFLQKFENTIASMPDRKVAMTVVSSPGTSNIKAPRATANNTETPAQESTSGTSQYSNPLNDSLSNNLSGYDSISDPELRSTDTDLSLLEQIVARANLTNCQNSSLQ